MAQATLLSTASTHNVFRGTGTYYGMTVSPGNGGTVVLTDVAEVGATAMNINSPAAALNPFLKLGPFSASSTTPADSFEGHGTRISNGLNVSYTSTMTVTVYFDD